MTGHQQRDFRLCSCRPFRLLAVLIFCLSLLAGPVCALENKIGNSGIAVIYPEIADPYRSIFLRIIEGVEDKLQTKIPSFTISNHLQVIDLQENLKQHNIKVVIALGRQGMRAARLLPKEYGIVVGGVLISNESEARGVAIYTLTPDPGLLFQRLKSLMPGAKRVAVVYDPKQNEWLIKNARQSAKSLGLELQAYEVSDLKGALAKYQDFLSNADPAKDALWLPHDGTTVQDSAILPMILRSAWDRNLHVFSSTLSHVEKGVLFSLYPDNLDMGRTLATLARARLQGKDTQSILSLREVMAAINVSTASHLGISMSNRKQHFDMFFPEQ